MNNILEGIIVDDTPAGLVQVQPLRVQALFLEQETLQTLLGAIRQEALKDFTPDLSTKASRDRIASLAFRVTKTKTYLDSLGKDEVAILKELPKRLDEGRRIARDYLDTLRDEVRQELTEWEARAEKQKAAIAGIVGYPAAYQGATSDKIAAGIAGLATQDTSPAVFGEFSEEATQAKQAALATLQDMRKARLQAEADQAELEALRAEQARRDQEDRERQIAAQAADKARIQAEQRAQAEQDAAARREAEAKLARERAERELEDERRRASEREARAREEATQAERRRQEAEQQEAERQARAAQVEADRKAADTEHRRIYNREALADLLTAIRNTVTPEGESSDRWIALSVLTAVVTGKVAHIRLTY